jgi:type I restriction enzyme S subunit
VPASAWKEIRVEELVAKKRYSISMGPFGSRITKDNFVSSGVPVIRGVNLSLGRFYPEGFVFLTEDKADELISSNAYPDDLVFTHRGTLGQVGIIPRGLFQRYVASQSQMKVTFDASIVSPMFMFYYFSSVGKTELLKHISGSGVPSIASPLTTLRNLRVRIPSLPLQQKIASVLSAYDDLIENNLRRIKILEEMAQNLYREWFVKFRFPACAEASAGRPGHEKVKMVDSPLGKIPDGWEIKNLFELADVTYGFPFKSSLFNVNGEGIPVIRIRDVLNGQSSTFTTEDAPDKYIVHDGDFLVGMDGDFHMGFWAGGNAFLVQRVARFCPKGDVGRYGLALALQEPIKHFNKTITGTTVAHLGDNHLRTINILMPDKKLLRVINDILEPLLDLQLNLHANNKNLRRTRDLLLPKLISGEVDVSELDIKQVRGNLKIFS